MALKKNNKGGGKMKTTQKNKKTAKSPFAMKDMLVSLNDTVKRTSKRAKKTISKLQLNDFRKAPKNIIDQANKIISKIGGVAIPKTGKPEEYAQAATFLKHYKLSQKVTGAKSAFDSLGAFGNALVDTLDEDAKKIMRASLHKEIGELRALKSVDPKIKELISQKTKRLNSLRSKKVTIPTISMSPPPTSRPSPAERASKRKERQTKKGASGKMDE